MLVHDLVVSLIIRKREGKTAVVRCVDKVNSAFSSRKSEESSVVRIEGAFVVVDGESENSRSFATESRSLSMKLTSKTKILKLKYMPCVENLTQGPKKQT